MDVPTVIQCNYLMILWKNCKLWTVLATQFMYSLGLSLCSFSKLDNILIHACTSPHAVIEMFELWSFLFWPLSFLILQVNTVLFFFSLQPHLASSTVIHTDTYREEVCQKSFYLMNVFRNIPGVCYHPLKKNKIKFKIIPSGLWHLGYQGENSFFIKICD